MSKKKIGSDPKSLAKYSSKILILISKFSASIFIVWWLAQRLNIQQILENLKEIPVWAVSTSFFIAIVQMIVTTWRLQILLTANHHIRKFITLFRIVLVGYFYSQTMISFIGGDGIKIWQLNRRGIAIKDATHNVFIERFSGLSTQLIIMLITFPLIIPLIDSTEKKLALLSISVSGLTVICCVYSFHKIHEKWKLSSKIIRHLDELSRTVMRATTDRTVLFKAILSSALVVFLNALVVYTYFLAEHVEISLLQVIILTPTVFFLSMMPISFAGWGVREAAMATAFSLVNVPQDKSIVVSMAFGITFLVASLPGSVLLFSFKDRKVNEILKEPV